MWVVVTTAAEMTVTNIYLIAPGSATYTEELYMSFALGADAGEVTLSVLPGLVSLAILLGTTLLLATEISRRRVLSKVSRPLALPAGAYRWPLTALLWSGVLALLGPPIASLIVKAGFVVVEIDGQRVRSWSAAKCLQEVLRAPAAFREEFGWTAVLALLAATLAIVVAVALAWLARRGNWRACRPC